MFKKGAVYPEGGDLGRRHPTLGTNYRIPALTMIISMVQNCCGGIWLIPVVSRTAIQ